MGCHDKRPGVVVCPSVEKSWVEGRTVTVVSRAGSSMAGHLVLYAYSASSLLPLLSLTGFDPQDPDQPGSVTESDDNNSSECETNPKKCCLW